MAIKFFVVAVLLVILYCLVSALYYLLYRKDPAHTVKALTWRISLSVALFILLFISYGFGWIHPHGVLPVS